MSKWLLGVMLLPGFLRAEAPLFRDVFKSGDLWRVEAAATARLAFDEGTGMTITNRTGITVWFRHRLTAPVTISYTATVRSTGRVSDLNCFWMATDPAQPDGDLFAPGAGRRDGTFASYDALRTYYVGYGGNTNTTTRFRRYDGTGARPLLPAHDLSAPEFLLQPDQAYRITITADENGRVQFIRDGEVVFDWTDPAPLRSGWFGFRSVDSQIEIRDFAVHAGVSPTAAAR
ncbi:hypothetical protein Verru16b_01281 [Lacunisphaera limnophila]|uniref:DUF6250 domain-containing protein n=1 Tax=Lacunisphaera limnophila TaxID=1838286 RepID=A0A1D8ATM8_9BACT|nr:DUF6250 domain-containing protein [Lacunisphaera limnophila]AOS44220.1 hypothetical protein Verru16b_01281 [Lacunisphaera limnophila]